MVGLSVNDPVAALLTRVTRRRVVGAIVGTALGGFLTRPEARPVGAQREFRIAVLGDSVVWGQGLREEHKIETIISSWLKTELGVPSARWGDVVFQPLAHSGAPIEGPRGSTLHGELPHGSPSISEQVDLIEDPASVDLVIVDGGGNDMDVMKLLDPTVGPNWVRGQAETYCGRMAPLLEKLMARCPSATIVVCGYFPIISVDTPMAEVAKVVSAVLAEVFSVDVGGPAAALAAAAGWRPKLMDLSGAWRDGANTTLRRVVGDTRSPRVRFADPGFANAHCYGTSSSRLWKLEVTGWPVAMLEVRTDDELYNYRANLCAGVYSATHIYPIHLAAAKCRLAAIAHPNRAGARAYAVAIARQLRDVLPGWGAPPPPTFQTQRPAVFPINAPANQKALYGVTGDGRVAQLWDWNTDNWHLDFLAEKAGQPGLRFQGSPAVFGRIREVFGAPIDARKSLYALTGDGRLAQLWDDACGWRLDWPAELAGQSGLRFQGAPAVFPTNAAANRKSLYAVTSDGRLAQLWDDAGGWRLDWPAEEVLNL